MHGRGEEGVKGFGGEVRRKEPLERPRHGWEVGIKKDGRVGWDGAEWIHLAQDRDWWWALVETVMNPRVLAPRSLLFKLN
jgi:hypothetical protein